MDVKRRVFILVIVLISIVQLFQVECTIPVKEPQTSEELFDAYYQPLSEETWQKEMPRNPETDACIQLYVTQQYEEAIVKMTKMAETTPQKDQFVLRLYWGLCHLNLNQTVEAYTLFNQVDPNSAVGEIAEWYKGLAFLKTEKIEQAKTSFRTIKAQKNAYFKDASSILEKLLAK